MTEQENKELIHNKLYAFCEEELDMLEMLYKLPMEDLKSQENQTLSSISLDVVHSAEKKVIDVLKETGVKYPQTVWSSIQPKLPSLSFQYIDWNSYQSYASAKQKIQRNSSTEKSKETYQRNITNRDEENILKKNGKLLIPAGGLAIGSVVFMALHIGPRTIWIIGLVAAAATAGYVMIQNLFSTKKGHETHQRPQPKRESHQPESQDPFVNLKKIISSVHKTNKEILVQWSQTLEKEIIAAWMEAEKE